MKRTLLAVAVVTLLLVFKIAGAETQLPESPSATEPAAIAPAKSIGTGLLLEPPLDLDWYTKKMFIEECSKVGAEKIGKKWTSPVVKLPERQRSPKQGLTQDEVKQYMLNVKQLFDEGKAIPMSDAGLISTQEDVIREPMLNHISAFENSDVRAYLLVQRPNSGDGWGYFSIVQDMTLDPPLDYYSEIRGTEVIFEGNSCYKCHSSGPLAIHPAREDLVLDAKLAAALSEHIAEQPRSDFYFPDRSPKPETGKQMTVAACTACHSEDGIRAPLYQVHFHPIRTLVDFGYMPPDEKLSPEEVAQLKAWLEDKE